MKKLLALVLCLGLASALLVGCGGEVVDENIRIGTRGELTVWYPGAILQGQNVHLPVFGNLQHVLLRSLQIAWCH